MHDKCRSGDRVDTESQLSTEGKLYLGLNYRSEETWDPSSRPCKQNAATWKPLTVVEMTIEIREVYMWAWAREAGKQSLEGDPDPADTDKRYTALFPNNNALAVNLILILMTKYGAHTAEQCVCYV